MATIAALIVRVAADVSELKTNMEKAQGFIEKTAKALAGAWVVSKIIDAAQATIEFAGSMADLSVRTGIGVEALQQFNYAGTLTGVTLEKTVRIIGDMQKRLAEGDKSTVGALTALGLKLEDLRAMRPEEQFTAIAGKLKDVADHTARAKLATDALGRGALEAMPLLVSNFEAVRAEAERLGIVLDQQTIDALDAFGDSLDTLQLVGQTTLARVLVPMTPALTDLATSFSRLPDVIDAVVLGFDATVFAGTKVIQALAKVAEVGLKIQKFNPLADQAVLDAQLAQMQQVVAWAKEWEQAVVNVDRSHQGAAASAKKHADAVPPLELRYGAAADAAAKAAAEVEKLQQKEKELFFDMRMFGVRMIREMTEEVNAELRKQMEAIGAAQLAIRSMEQETAKRVGGLFGPAAIAGLDAEIKSLQDEYTKRMQQLEIEALAIPANDTATQARIQSIRDMLNVEYDRMFNDIVARANGFTGDMEQTISSSAAPLASASQAAVQPIVNNFIGAFNQVTAGARRMVGDVSAQLRMLDDAYRAAGIFVDDTRSSVINFWQHQANPRTPPPGMPFMEKGGPVLKDGPIYAHAGEYVVPKGGAVGGLTLNVYVTSGSGSGPGDAARAGRQAADAIVARLRGAGYRV